MLTKKKNLLIPSTLAIVGQGETINFDLTYRNVTQEEINAAMNEGSDPGDGVAKTVLLMVESWDSEYELTREGVEEMEKDRPGMIVAIIQGWHQSRQVAKAKN